MATKTQMSKYGKVLAMAKGKGGGKSMPMKPKDMPMKGKKGC